ncbi:MAG: hypothetical protein KAT37_00590 [Candidatus Aenigmarchaeota archaeon]|nr:hypothetical protein [Candidatus Aenigmarchaeota archaeon]
MTMENTIEATLLRKLHKMRCWGKHHICESNLPKGFPKNLYKEVMKAADDLRRRGLLVKHPTHHENQWHLNWDKKEEIERIIRN